MQDTFTTAKYIHYNITAIETFLDIKRPKLNLAA